MLKNIRLLQNIAKGYIIVSAVVIISMIFYQSFLDSDKSALNNYFIDQDNYIKEFSEKLEIEKLERHLLMRYIKNNSRTRCKYNSRTRSFSWRFSNES